MTYIDWLVLIGVLLFITIYGIYKTRGQKDIEGYLRGNNSVPWYMVGFSIMATQASAITFLSAPGQAFTDGMRFIQFYFGLPIAMVIICITVIPIYHKLKIYTAYEFLEGRFDLKTRSLAALLFLTQRGIAAGLTIYAPAIILSTLLDWNIYYTNIFIGAFVIVYTVSGGTKAVSITQQWQMGVILFGMLLAGIFVINSLPTDVSFGNAVNLAGKLGKLNAIDFNFDLNNRYNIWSGLIGGLFLMLSYFGTDQSQVSRYISGKSIKEIRMGLLMNGMVKIPMQFAILFIGAMLFVFYQFNKQPIFFNLNEVAKVKQGNFADNFNTIETDFNLVQQQKQTAVNNLLQGVKQQDNNTITVNKALVKDLQTKQNEIRKSGIDLIKKSNPSADDNDTNYIFLTYVLQFFPPGLIGLLIAVMFSASMSSTSSELNALAGTTVVDIYKRSIKQNGSDKHYLQASKFATLIWGVIAIAVAEFANKLGSLIEAVNVLGSLFYGTILGIFLVGFYIKQVKGGAAFYAAIVAEVCVLLLYKYSNIGFLWFNLIGCFLVVVLSLIIYQFIKTKKVVI